MLTDALQFPSGKWYQEGSGAFGEWSWERSFLLGRGHALGLADDLGDNGAQGKIRVLRGFASEPRLTLTREKTNRAIGVGKFTLQ